MSAFDFCLTKLALKDGRIIHYHSLNALEEQGLGAISTFPFSKKILLESLLRMQGRAAFTEEHVRSFARPEAGADAAEFPFLPSRVLLQDFTGVPCVVDLAALRSALKRAGGDPKKIEPRIPVDLIIDHSVQLDLAGCPNALEANMRKEFQRNRERYLLLRWGRGAFERLNILPPGLGICHQVNMEYLARCVATAEDDAGRAIAFPDTCVGTDSHTTTVNSMGVLGWGVGGIEAEAAMLGQPISLLRPGVVGLRLAGRLRVDATPTDLALTVTQRLREVGVVGRFVEFFGPGLASLSLADRAPVANMAPEYGATMGFFPVDDATLRYLRETGRSDEQVDLVERYCRTQGLFHLPGATPPEYDEVVELNLDEIEPCVAGPRKPHDRIVISQLDEAFRAALAAPSERGGFALAESDLYASATAGELGTVEHGAVVIASITSCTNTANPALLLAAGILAKKAVEKGLRVPRTVRTSFAPGSRAAAEYLERAGLLRPLEELGFHIAAYGCATCIGNSGPLAPDIRKAIAEKNLVAAAVVSGNRNFEGRIHPLTKANYLCSPLMVVAYALRGTVAANLAEEPIGLDTRGNPVTLDDLRPTPKELRDAMRYAADPEIYRTVYGDIGELNPDWNALPETAEPVCEWRADSTYIREPPFFINFSKDVRQPADIRNAAVLALFGDFITTDHISPAGAIPQDSPAAQYLVERGVTPEEFNSFGARRGNHEVMMRGTFGNIRIRNKLADREGGWTIFHPTGETLSIYDAAMRYREAGAPLVVIAGKLYGAGSSRDWAAKGPALIGVVAVIAESFERIHRSNLVEMGVLPIEFLPGENAESLGLTGAESVAISGIAEGLVPGKLLTVTATAAYGRVTTFKGRCRIDTPVEVEYYCHGGILDYVLRGIMQQS